MRDGRVNDFRRGLQDGIPIAMGYLPISFSLGILAVESRLSVVEATVMSATNITSAGQFAGIGIIAASGTIFSMILTQLLINLRYALMGLALSQRLDPKTRMWQRFVAAFANTDEVFAVAMQKKQRLRFEYMLGLELLPVLSWTIGTLLGAVAKDLLPASLCSALNLALYAMFIAIVLPVARRSRTVLMVVLIAIVVSCLIHGLPFLASIPTGLDVIISTVIAATVGALMSSSEDAP